MELKFRLLLQKAYFDKGFGLTNYFKYVLILFGWATDDVKNTIIVGILWIVSCWIIGRLWFRFKLVDIENEINNIFNPFQREVRQHLKRRKI